MKLSQRVGITLLNVEIKNRCSKARFYNGVSKKMGD